MDVIIGAVWMSAVIAATWLGLEYWGDGGGWAIFIAVVLVCKETVSLKFTSPKE